MEKIITLEDIMKEDFDWSLVKIYAEAYLPLENKVQVMTKIVNECIKVADNGYVKCDTILKRMLIHFYLLNIYTNVKADNISMEIYDRIASNIKLETLLTYDGYILIEMINDGIEDALSMNTLEYTMKDIQHQLVSYGDIVVEKTGNFLDRGDPNKVAKYLSKGVEVFGEQLSKFVNLAKEREETLKGVLRNAKQDSNPNSN